MERKMSTSDVLAEMRREHDEMERLLGELGEKRMLEPSLEGGWSVKDVLAHIASWERLMVGWLAQMARGETPNLYAPGFPASDGGRAIDSLNERLHSENRSRPLNEVLTGFREAYRQALDAVTRLTDEQLNDRNYYPWREGRPLLSLIAGNTFGHYQEHIEDMQKRFNLSTQA